MEIEVYSSDDEEVEDEEHGSRSSTSYAVIALCLFLLSWQSSFRVPDTSIGALLAFMHHFLLFVSAVTHSEQLSMIAQNLPKTVKELRTVAGIDVDSFAKFVVCSLCHSIYYSDACLLTVGSRKEVKKCQHSISGSSLCSFPQEM